MDTNRKVYTMKLHWALLAALNLLLTDISKGNDGTSVTTEFLAKQAGYPYEAHQCETPDGYVLTIHRIPYSARIDTPTPRPVAFLMHGIFFSSSNWLISGPDSALAYVLSDAGYDVWIGNARGNRYSRKHITLSPSSAAFWKFDWHEIGASDLPTMIGYILTFRGVDQIHYIGHSQGTTAFMVLASMNPKFTSCIKSAHLLAPATYMNHMKNTFPIASLLCGLPQPFKRIVSDFEILRNNKLQEVIANTVCIDGSPLQFLCALVIFLIAGFSPNNLNTTLLPTIFSTFPDGASVNQACHYLQEHKSGHFRQFDYDLFDNYRKYGSRVPPDYPLSNVTAPIYLYYSSNDWLVSVEDVHRLIGILPSLRGEFLVKDEEFNHFDFLWGINATTKVYDKLMQDMQTMG